MQLPKEKENRSSVYLSIFLNTCNSLAFEYTKYIMYMIQRINIRHVVDY